MKLDRVIAVRNNKTIYRDGDNALRFLILIIQKQMFLTKH